MGYDSDRGDAVCHFEKWRDQPGHVENLDRPGKDGEGFRVFRLRRVGLDEPPSQVAASALIRQKQADRPSAHDQDIRVDCGINHDVTSIAQSTSLDQPSF
jgi:hypothetical protein